MKSEVKKMSESAFFLALGVLIPMIFHLAAPATGYIFDPMHLPALLAGFIVGPLYGLMVGVLSPLLSFLFTGMPSVAALPAMMIELGAYGLFTGLFYRLIKTKWFYLDIYITLAIALILGRVLGGLTNLGIYASNVAKGTSGAVYYTWNAFFAGYFVKTFPGIILQVVLIPLVIIALNKSHLMSEKDRQLFPERQQNEAALKEAAYFDGISEEWNQKRLIDEKRIAGLLGKCALSGKETVLDVGCGNGLIDPYLVAHAQQVVGIDVSTKMIHSALLKNAYPNLCYEAIDFYAYERKEKVDVIILFDSYPHFEDKGSFKEKCASLLKKGGKLYIIHGASKEEINAHHAQTGAKNVSVPLKEPKKEAFRYWTSFKRGNSEDSQDHYFLELIRK